MEGHARVARHVGAYQEFPSEQRKASFRVGAMSFVSVLHQKLELLVCLIDVHHTGFEGRDLCELCHLIRWSCEASRDLE